MRTILSTALAVSALIVASVEAEQKDKKSKESYDIVIEDAKKIVQWFGLTNGVAMYCQEHLSSAMPKWDNLLRAELQEWNRRHHEFVDKSLDILVTLGIDVEAEAESANRDAVSVVDNSFNAILCCAGIPARLKSGDIDMRKQPQLQERIERVMNFDI